MITPPTVHDVLAQLRTEGVRVASDDAAIAQALEPSGDRPGASQAWYVRVLVGLGAWAATGFFLGFLGIAGAIDQRASAVVLGAVLVVAATILRRRATHDGLVQLALSVCLAGRCLIYGGLGREPATGALAAIALESVMIAVYPDAVNRFLATGGVWAAVLVLLDSLEAPSLVAELATVGLGALTALAWERAPSLAARPGGELHTPVATAMATTLLATTVVKPWRFYDVLWLHEARLAPVVALGLTAVLAWVIGRVRREHLGRPAWGAIAVAVAFGLLTSPSPTLVASVTVLALAVHRRQRVLFGLGAAGFAVGLFRFYYDLEVTLLAKAALLVVSGALLLAARVSVEASARRLERS